MKSPVAYVDVRFSSHATEDPEKVKKAAYNLFPLERVDEVIFREDVIKGHHGNPIILFEARIKDDALTGAFVEKLSVSLSELDKETMLRESDLYIEKSNLYLRLDKQALFGGEFKLGKSDPVHIRVHFKKKDERSVVEICRELGLMP